MSAPAGPDLFERLRGVADAVLYEGYLLYPYRRSSGKNRVRWQFGVLVPRGWLAARGELDEHGVAGSVESAFQQTECLLQPGQAVRVHVRLRFLQLQRKQVLVAQAEGGYAPVEAVQLGDTAQLSFDEAVPHERDVILDLDPATVDGRHGPIRTAVLVPPGEQMEEPADGVRVVRYRDTITLAVEVSTEPVADEGEVLRLRVRTSNDYDVPADLDRTAALRHAALASHTLLAVPGGQFVSLLDPPAALSEAARACRNVHTFPVLAGDVAGDPQHSDLMLSAPIIMYDHPRVAPESPADLHDAAEIDEILSLRTLTLTEAEKREARATDPRAAAIVDRVEQMPPEAFARLHGAIRGMEPAKPAWFAEDEQAPDPERDSIQVNGVTVRQGTRVRLRPRPRGTDPHDMFLAGRTAVVARVHQEMSGTRMVAVLLEGDPAADLIPDYGRCRYFAPEEIEPLPAAGSAHVVEG